MTFISNTRRVKGRTRWGLFHNLDTQYEQVAYVFVHIAGRMFGLTWERWA